MSRTGEQPPESSFIGRFFKKDGLHWVVTATIKRNDWTNYRVTCLDDGERDVWRLDRFYECQKLTLEELPTEVLLRADMSLLTMLHRYFAENMRCV